MKDIVITKRIVKRELYIFLACVVAMELLNVYAIAEKNGQWSELFMSLGYVCVAAGVLYVVLAVIRLVVIAIWSRATAKSKKNRPSY